MLVTIIVVVLVICMMLGPIMMIQPSAKQKRLAKLREHAVMQGLSVRHCQNPASSTPKYLTVYSKKWSALENFAQISKKLEALDSCLLVKKDYDHGLHFANEWDWALKPTEVSAFEIPLKNCLAMIPKSVLAIEITPDACGLYWSENHKGETKEKAVSKIQTILRALYTDVLHNI